MRARYYNPDIKRFINQDIKVGDISNGQSLNRYAYCEGNPVSMVDPFGLCGQDPNALTIHDILGLVGFASSFFGLPGMAVGAMADAVDFVLYCKEKDPLNAVLALICVVPVVGDAVGLIAKGGRYLRTGAKIANLLQDSGKMIKSADKAVSAFKINQNIKQSGIGNGIATVLYAAGKMLISGMKKGSTKLLDFGSVIKKQAESLYTSAKSAVKRLSKGGGENYTKILNIGAGELPIPCATNIDINPRIPGVLFGDANDLRKYNDGIFDHVLALNPHGYNPLNSDIPRVLKDDGILTITGNLSNNYFKKIYRASPEILLQAGFEIVSQGKAPDILIKYGHKVTDGTRNVNGEIFQIVLRKVGGR